MCLRLLPSKRWREIYTLAIDTCLAALSVGIGDGKDNFVRSRQIGVGHAEHLAPLVAEILEERSIHAEEIGDLVVTTGPGSFMGARVGISFAAGFALPRKLPTRPVTTLSALWLSAPLDAKGAVLIDARRGQVYGQIFGHTQGEPFLLDIDDARRATVTLIEENGILMGSGASLVWPDHYVTGPQFPDVEVLVNAAPGLASGPLRPLYLRAPDATPMKVPS